MYLYIGLRFKRTIMFYATPQNGCAESAALIL